MSSKSTTHPGFPTTHYSWIDDRLERGSKGESEVIGHIMRVYSGPLASYVANSRRLRWPDPQDLVNEFLADGLQRPQYVQRWRDSAVLHLRVWLINGLHFQHRKWLRQASDELRKVEEFAWDEAACWSRVEASSFEAMLASWRKRIVELALEQAGEHCKARGLHEGWADFEAHHFKRETYVSIAARTGRTARQVEVRARAGIQAFRRELHDLLEREGIPRSRAADELLDQPLAEVIGR